MQACDRCHARKTRCDRLIPCCGACEKAGAACLHLDKLRHRNLPRGYVESVEAQLREVEEENTKLRRRLMFVQTQTSAANNNSANSNPTAVSNADPSSGNVIQNAGNEREASQDSNDNDGSATNPDIFTAAGTSKPNRAGADSSEPVASPSSRSSSTTTKDAVTSEVICLSLKTIGDTRYLGTSSGIDLARAISSMLNPQNGDDLGPVEPDCAVAPLMTANPADAPFPPRGLAMQFIDAYFQHTHITFPLLHRPSFLRAVECIYDDQNYYGTHIFDAFAFDMVLAIGSANLNRSEESITATAANYARAQTKVYALFSMKGFVSLQTILLLSQYKVYNDLRDTSASIWHLIGMGARICVELGLQLEPKSINLQNGPPLPPSAPIPLEVEMRKRCFWCFYNLDRIISFTLGRPVAIRDQDMDISLPSHLDDDKFGPNLPIYPDMNRSANPKPSPFLHLIRLRRLSGKILSTLYAAKESNDIPIEEKKRTRRQLHHELLAWRKDTALVLLADRPWGDGTFLSCFLTQEWYKAIFNNAMLHLYRPSPYLPDPTTPTVPGAEEGDLHLLFNAARISIKSYYDLHRMRRLSYSWITLHGVFIAGLAYLYGIGQALKDPARYMLPDYLDVINDSRTCSNILVAICERCNEARSSCELFNRLSNIVIRDAVNLARKPPDTGTFHGFHNDDFTTRSRTPLWASEPPQVNFDDVLQGSRPDSTSSIVEGTAAPDIRAQQVLMADQFRHYSGNLESPFLGVPPLQSEPMMGLSQDWPFYEVDFSTQEEFPVPMEVGRNLW